MLRNNLKGTEYSEHRLDGNRAEKLDFLTFQYFVY